MVKIFTTLFNFIATSLEKVAKIKCFSDIIISYMYMGGSQKRCTKGGDHVRECITHLLSIKNSNVDDFHVSIAINILYLK